MGHILQIKSWIKQKGMNFDYNFRLFTLLFFFPLFLGEKRKGKRITKVVVKSHAFRNSKYYVSAPDEKSSHGGHRGRVMKRFSAPPPLLSVFPKWQNLLRGGQKIIWIPSRREIAPTNNCTHLLRNVLNLFVCIIFNYFL